MCYYPFLAMKTIAAFDFDGTLTYRDTLLPFLIFVRGPLRSLWFLLLELPYIIGFVIGLASRQKTKERVITRFFAGMPIELIRKKAEEFARGPLNRHVKPKALKRLKWHVDKGQHCLIVSASIDIYLQPWAKQHGLNGIITSSLEVTGQGTITGKLKGRNCWGPEKVRRLTEQLGPKTGYTLYAYGDSRGDRELLNFADYPYYRTVQTPRKLGD